MRMPIIKKHITSAKKRKSILDSQHFVVQGVLQREGKLGRQKQSVFLVSVRTAKYYNLQVYIFVVLNIGWIQVLIRIILAFVVIFLCSPEYIFCMDNNLIDPNNFNGEDTTHNLNALSSAKSTLEKCEADILCIRDRRLDESEIHVIHKKARKILSATRTVGGSLNAMETHSYTKLSDFNGRLDYLKQIAVSQQQPVSNHNSILDPTDSSLWKNLQKYNLTSIFTIAAAGTSLAFTLAVILSKKS